MQFTCVLTALVLTDIKDFQIRLRDLTKRFSRILKKDAPESFVSTFLNQKGWHGFLLKKVKPSLLITCFRHYDILTKTRNRQTTVIAFSRQNDAGSPVRTT